MQAALKALKELRSSMLLCVETNKAIIVYGESGDSSASWTFIISLVDHGEID